MKTFRKLLWPIAALLLGTGLTLFARRATHHFTSDRLTSTIAYHPEWEFPNLPGIESILDQPFHFYIKGGESWVFVSADGQWVLKFFDFRLTWRDIAIKLHLPESLTPSLTQKQTELREWPIKGYALAFEKCKEICGFKGIFLNGKKSGITTIKIYNPIHCQSELDLSKASFIIQKKADATLPELFFRLLKKGDTQQASIILSKALNLIASRCAAGIADVDHWRLHRNIGFIGDEPIYLDAGKFREDPTLFDPKNAEAEILKAADLLISKLAKD